ncbi:class I SAM-dependent methyltransferase [uncultured Zhongshania sp.]|jgi:SAM-dependent methyltransferase|uniref:class I SAM-dependent methyltransferase n=1 Tax=uncultured Zhongshania sp. TaxID=1642288 RepID=UPI0025E37729|nr:class I SAM-dependent methyltransferase [uncultured Zhongshania sp.]
MSSREISEYFDATESRDTRDDLKHGVELVEGPRIAIDCGCGAGSDIAFLRANGFFVHAFDVELEAITRCGRRFSGDGNVRLSQDSFSSYDYPRASLIVADASLFFCPEDEFSDVWNKINEALLPGGVFVGSFLGPEDTMAGTGFDREAFWPNVLVASEYKVKEWLKPFEVVSFIEHRKSGAAPGGSHHHWHIYSVVARKEFNNAIQATANASAD